MSEKTIPISRRQRQRAREAIEGAPRRHAPLPAREQPTFDPNKTYQEIVLSNRWQTLRDPAYHQYRRLWEDVPAQKVTREFPLHLDIETTNLCNLRCPMCPRTLAIASDKFSSLGMLSRHDYRKIVDEASQYDLKSIKLNYLGEPLLHPDIPWQIAYAKQHGVIDVMLNTNATLLTPKLGQALLEAGLDNLFVSFDAVNPKDFEQQRPGASLGKVIDQVYRFVKLRDQLRPGCQVRLSMVMYREPKWQAQFEALQVMWKDVVDAIGYGYYVERDPQHQDDYPEVPGFHCAQPYQRMFLKYNGNVTVCCVDDKDEEIMGNWRHQSLHAIWHGERYREFRRRHTEDEYYRIPMCRRCYLPVSR